MDFMLFVQALFALIVVVGLVLLVFGTMKYCELKGCKSPFLRKLNIQGRLSVIETKRIDAKNTLVIAKCDDEEFIILLGVCGAILLKTKKVDNDV